MEEQRIAKAHKLVVNNRKTSTVTGEKGEVDLSGNIDSIAYSSVTPQAKQGDSFLTKLFK